jgi:hypothetical protein
MTDKKKCGALPKFPNVETTKLRIDRVVPKKHHNEWKQKVNQFINQLQQDYERL